MATYIFPLELSLVVVSVRHPLHIADSASAVGASDPS